MNHPDESGFHALARQGYSRIPLTRERLADLDTPLSTYLRLAQGPYTYLFESAHSGEKWGRYSIIGLPAVRVFRFYGNSLQVEEHGEPVRTRECDNALTEVERIRNGYRVPELPGMPRFSGGLVGYFAYDVICRMEMRIDTSGMKDPLGVPDILLLESTELIVYDNLLGRLRIIVHVDPEVENAWQEGQRRLDELEACLSQAWVPRSYMRDVGGEDDVSDFSTGFSRSRFEEAVRRIKAYIRDGDVMQTVLSQRLSAPFHGQPVDLYRALRCLNPSPYMYYLQMKDFHIVGSSPEILVRMEGEIVTLRPIAGTRPRGTTEMEDRALEKELLSDPKELAEHLMLIDLGRNDIGRVTVGGSVRVTEKMVIERYSHVMHIVSNVCGRLRSGMSAMDVLRATFPAGTVSGAPKIRAMEIIAELEPVRRGIYAGAVGYLGWDGNMDTAIAIRTAVIQGETLHIQAGCGVVADSDPQAEWQESLNKGKVIFRALSMVRRNMPHSA